jgi:hypothetical protein
MPLKAPGPASRLVRWSRRLGGSFHAEVYHTSEDTVDHIEEKAVEEAVFAGIKLVELV